MAKMAQVESDSVVRSTNPMNSKGRVSSIGPISDPARTLSRTEKGRTEKGRTEIGRTENGWLGWMVNRWKGAFVLPRRLALVERIALSPRNSLALVEAEGMRLLVATSQDGGPAFFSLTAQPASGPGDRLPPPRRGRVSW